MVTRTSIILGRSRNLERSSARFPERVLPDKRQHVQRVMYAFCSQHGVGIFLPPFLSDRVRVVLILYWFGTVHLLHILSHSAYTQTSPPYPGHACVSLSPRAPGCALLSNISPWSFWCDTVTAEHWHAYVLYRPFSLGLKAIL